MSKTKLYGLIGYPLSHSYSEAYFTLKFQDLGLKDHTYGLIPMKHIENLPQLLHDEPNLLGYNVTIPHKQAVIEYLDELDEMAEAIGAVNVVVRIPRGWKGYNTDAPAFQKTLGEWVKQPVDGALILGSGGASSAVQHVLKQMEIPYKVVSRSSVRGDLTYKQIDNNILNDHHLIIQTTPVGAAPDTLQVPQLPYEHLTPEHQLYDLIYNPEETAFLREGREQGAMTRNGLEMLHNQADQSWDIWKSHNSAQFE